MKQLVSALFLLLSLGACSSCSKNLRSFLPPPLKVPPSIVLIGKGGAAHACPVDGMVITSEHVGYDTMVITHEKILSYYVYEWNETIGMATPLTYNLVVDLALLELEPPITEFYARGALPQVGDTVRWIEFDFTNRGRAFNPRPRRATVVAVVAGHIIFDQEPTAGASGSCLFNDANEAVGIISFGDRMQDNTMIGGAVSLETLP